MLEVPRSDKRFRSATVVDHVSFTLRPERSRILGPTARKVPTGEDDRGAAASQRRAGALDGRDVRGPGPRSGRLGLFPRAESLFVF